MELVVDTNIVFSLFKSDSFTRKLIKRYNLRLLGPESLIKELDKYRELICSKSKVPLELYTEAKQAALALIEIIPESKEFLLKAEPLISDQSDVPFLALSLEFNNVPIWSNNSHLKEQSLVKVFTTEELDQFLKESFSI